MRNRYIYLRRKIFKQAGLLLAALLMMPGLSFGLEFDFAAKGEDKEVDLLTMSNYIKEARWVGNDLVISAVIRTNCAINRFKGYAQSEGDRLELQVKEQPPLGLARCDKNEDVVFTMKGLEKKDWELVLTAYGYSGPVHDIMQIKADGTTSDACDVSPDFFCYRRRGKPEPVSKSPLEKRTQNEPSITFEDPGLEAVSKKYPEFMRYFVKENFGDMYQNYAISFKKPDIMVRSSSPGGGGFSVRNLYEARGDTFEEAVKNYLERHERRYGPGSLRDRVARRIGMNILQVSPNESFIDVEYNGEIVNYSPRSMRLKSRRENHFFYFKQPFPEPVDATVDDIKEEFRLADLVYNIIRNDGRFENPDSWERSLMIDIDREKMTARFFTYLTPDESDTKRFMMIHNRQVRIMVPIQKTFRIDLKTARIERER